MPETSRHQPQPPLPPAPLALLFLGATASLYGLHSCGLFTIDPRLLGTGLFYGGIGLVLTGIADWRHHSPLGAVVGIAYGLFWLSLLGMIALPAAGYGHPSATISTGAYLAIWGLFTTVLFVGVEQGGRGLQTTLGLLLASLLLLAVGELGAATLPRMAGGWLALAAGVVALHNGTLRLLFEAGRRQAATRAPVRTP